MIKFNIKIYFFSVSCVNLNNMWCIYLTMSDSPIIDLDQDYAILNTNVTVGKSYKSRGWALSVKDIHEWIPVEEFEHDCKLIINNIRSDAVIRFNPRLFYESDELSLYLKELYDNGDNRSKIPMKIKIHKNNLFNNIYNVEKHTHLKNIETRLRVGKSYSSGGWQLSKDVVAQLFPVDQYDEIYSISINNIESNAKLNLQFRLFYKGNQLSEYLEELYHKDANERIPAKIIFEEGFNENEEIISTENENLDNPVKENDGDCICSSCGKNYSNIHPTTNNFLGFCPDCLEKIIALDEFKKIKESSLSNFVKKEFLEEKFGEDYNQIWDLLIKYHFLVKFGDLFKLTGNEDIELNYSKYLLECSASDNTRNIASKKRNRDKILELIDGDEEYENKVCTVCGSILKDSEIEKCGSCKDKSLACEYLKRFVTRVSYNKSFSERNLIKMEIPSLEVDLIINKLLNYDLILGESDGFYKLNNVNYLNDFINKYADSPYGLQTNNPNNDSDVLIISKSDLTSEDRIDALIKWNKYRKHVQFKKIQYEFTSVKFLNDGLFMYSKGFSTSYEAKREAINYLINMILIKMI